MNDITMDGPTVQSLAADWPHTVPPTAPHPLPPVGPSPVSAAFAAAVAAWPEVHAAMCADRVAHATRYVGSLSTTVGVLGTGDTDNAAEIYSTTKV